ncbi:hypothetical protein HDU91_005328 [Kappamyces sp. JEL0680]|nr:hypothetical protein HDU91_005328 [Kappamyces sp. JEL0680]
MVKIAALSAIALAAAKDSNVYELDYAITDSSLIEFSVHNSSAPFGSYLIQNLNFTLVTPIFNLLNATYGPLKNRGEAHITVITPPEFMSGLSTVLTMDDINTVAKNNNIQANRFDIVCVGRQSQMDSTTKPPARSSVFNILLEAPASLKIRKDVYALYLKKGGDPSNFNPYNFYPHITVGFEVKDWFPEDQVFKTKDTCIAPVKVINVPPTAAPVGPTSPVPAPQVPAPAASSATPGKPVSSTADAHYDESTTAPAASKPTGSVYSSATTTSISLVLLVALLAL